MKILIADDDRIARARLTRRLARWGYEVIEAEDGVQAWNLFQERTVDLVITDWMMPEMDGLELVRRIRGHESSYCYVVLLTARSETEDLVEALDAGADDFLSKPLNRSELRARLQAGERLIRLERELADRNRRMEKDLAAAADYVRSLLPPPIADPVRIDWKYVPAEDLAGDSLGYHWINEEQLAFYIIDVMGHGLDSALLSVSVLNTLRTMSLPATNFAEPGEVLQSLNDYFPMEKHGNKCFTIWYGVLSLNQRSLRWCGGGHPPAFRIGPTTHELLPTTGPMIGMMPGLTFESSETEINIGEHIVLYTDGAHEIDLGDDQQWDFAEFEAMVLDECRSGKQITETVFSHVQKIGGNEQLEDDFTLMVLHVTADSVT